MRNVDAGESGRGGRFSIGNQVLAQQWQCPSALTHRAFFRIRFREPTVRFRRWTALFRRFPASLSTWLIEAAYREWRSRAVLAARFDVSHARFLVRPRLPIRASYP